MITSEVHRSAVVEVPDKEMLEWLLSHGGVEDPPEGERWFIEGPTGEGGSTRFSLATEKAS